MAPRSASWRKGLVCAWMLMLVAALVLTARCEGNADNIAELMEMRERASDSVIRLDDDSLKRLVLPSDGRPYSLVVFFDAEQARTIAGRKQEELRREFGLAAAAFSKHHKGKESASKVFFVDLVLAQSQLAFSLFGVRSLPMIKYLPAGQVPLKDSQQLNVARLSKRAGDVLAAFVEAKTGHKVGPIERPPPVSRQQMVLIGIGLALAAPLLIKKLVAGNTVLHSKAVWCAGALVAYFLSISGVVFNVIKDMPFWKRGPHNPSELTFFHQGSGIQLGAEGLLVGFLYTVFGVMVALISHFLTRIRSPLARRLGMWMGTVLSIWAFKTIRDWAHWKTGYEMHFFWPRTPW